MTKPASTLAILRSPIVQQDGTLNDTGIQQFRIWGTQLQNGLDQIGNFIGNLQPSVQIVGKSGTVGTITQNINATGVVTANGIDFALPYLNKDTDHIADGTGSPLAGGKAAYRALVANAPISGNVLEWDGTNWQWVPRAQSIAQIIHQFLVNYDETTGAFGQAQPAFTDISGTATASQVPALSALNGQITSAQMPAGGASGTVTLAKLTTLGSTGSLTVLDGQITAIVNPT